jgi:peptidyl-prolyl cis-trans isomerase A (cyclophilin A)
MDTDFGEIEIELFQKEAPVTVANFLEYVHQDMYTNSKFYRVVTMENQPNNEVKIEVIQGGLGFGKEIERLDSIPMETTAETGIKHLNGTISMARSAPGSATSEFFICVGDQPELDYNGSRNPDKQGFAAFGKVVKGMDVVHKIHQSPSENQYLEPQIKILNVSKKGLNQE